MSKSNPHLAALLLTVLPHKNEMKRNVGEPQSPFILPLCVRSAFVKSLSCNHVCQTTIGVKFLSKQTWVSFSRIFRVQDSYYTIESLTGIVIPERSAPRPKWPSAISFRAPKQFVCCVCVCCCSKWVVCISSRCCVGPPRLGCIAQSVFLISRALDCVLV